ncbi:MAG: hypothetical protein M3Z26_09590 [Bacteroidota bacterium]|nr:hypothetical protein [Bacteroidota bacterium]
MKRFLAFVLLLSHMNTSMFLPQCPEEDVYDANGNQLDDITSVFEFVMVKIGLDHTADDENDDSGQNLHMVSSFQFTFEPFFTQTSKDYSENRTNLFAEYSHSKIPTVSYDIIIPPPKS